MIVLLCIAVAGALIRQFAARGSTLRDVGTLLMLLWLPIIGNIIAWLVARMRRPSAPEPETFGAPDTFQPHALVELTLRAAKLPSEDVPIPVGEHRCALVIASDGFSARWFVRPGEKVLRGKAHAVQMEFLTPTLALEKFQPQAAFRMLVGEAFVGDGRVLELLPSESTPA
ncbi:hypothetical protein QTI66_32480 [Variovorax sp. J22R133]|uniref:hypothetical protein n=1 Tax=Variovorax brevis TaxID=3053503 RepID=UPI0025783403|nr:hypothetical protein [Variovorax sp. J22R133]MDM0116846.1 hypothetical protein [Variovorax sp. J22R133]